MRKNLNRELWPLVPYYFKLIRPKLLTSILKINITSREFSWNLFYPYQRIWMLLIDRLLFSMTTTITTLMVLFWLIQRMKSEMCCKIIFLEKMSHVYSCFTFSIFKKRISTYIRSFYLCETHLQYLFYLFFVPSSSLAWNIGGKFVFFLMLLSSNCWIELYFDSWHPISWRILKSNSFGVYRKTQFGF